VPPINYKGIPFYSQISPAQYKTFTAPLVTLPPGTLLFRGITIPDTEQNEDPRKFFTEYLGSPDGRNMCLTPQHNTFFYPIPFVPFGTHTVGEKFNAIHVYVTTRPLNVISAIAPSPWSRGSPKKWAYADQTPWARCDVYTEWCKELSYIDRMALQYDNCINPEYAKATGTRGWMAVADLDSLKPYKLREGSARDSPMGGYLDALKKRDAELAYQLLIQTYVDERKHTGYPEIALYPLKTHPGNVLIKRPARDERAILKHMEELARTNELNFLPLATITSEGIADMVQGEYVLRSLPGAPPYRNRPHADGEAVVEPMRHHMRDVQPAIEIYLKQYLEALKTEGIKLPFYGQGSLSFDTRTGFSVLPQMIPKDLVVRGEKPADLVPYSSLLIRLNTADLRQRVIDYIVIFRTFLAQKYMNKYPLAKGFGIRRAFIFSRPGFFKRWFEELGFEIPKQLDDLGKRASRLFEENTGRREAKKAAAKAKAAAPGEEGGHTPPLYEPEPGAGFAPGARTPEYNATGEGTGAAAGFTPKTPEFGGGARRRYLTKRRGLKRKPRKTRRTTSKSVKVAVHKSMTQGQHRALKQFATLYKSIWSSVGKK
jgi:hypothetical protein